MSKELPKAYEPKEYEDNISASWETSGYYNPDQCIQAGITSNQAPAFSIVLPPPNVTGTLHMGHAAMLAIQDVLIRYHRMKGDKTLWLPGTDHAAVATESKVEKMLIDSGISHPKQTLGKDEFMKQVEKFAQESHDTIVNQCKKMGASLDWTREAYTKDDTRNKAVNMVFKQMYDDGLIYRGHRVVNWSVVGQSTCSDDELVHVERQATLYYFTYSHEFPIPIATTRPETKLGDTAVAVHPEGRWKDYIGKTYTITNFADSGNDLHITVIADEGIDDTFGTGALGVTPAHSHIDFDMYLKQKAAGTDIGLIQVIGEDGNMTTNAGTYAGQSTRDAKKNIVAWLDAQGLLQKTEDIMQNAGTSDRFKDVVEPLPKTQWFIDVNKKITGKGIFAGQELSLKEMMQSVIRDKHTTIIPDRFEKTYFHWIDNLRDWCISRQIWFGHQIPVWYKESQVYCGINAPQEEGWTQDQDTLDTWFSSGIWTFSTLLDKTTNATTLDEWLHASPDYQTYHPTTVLETGYDILFFWVARMILMTTYATGTVPFHHVYLHGLVRDEQGRKMSKTLGNIINPLDMIDSYGTDATRLSLLIGNTPGNDMKLSEEKIAGFRNFTNKLWNISRFMIGTMNTAGYHINPSISMPTPVTAADTWILTRLNTVIEQVTQDIDTYQFSLAGERLRDFTWNDLADWYLEIAKIEGDKSALLNYLLNTVLALWHPYMPFVTETIWQSVYGTQTSLMTTRFPIAQTVTQQGNPEDLQTFQRVVTTLRALRSEHRIPPSQKVSAVCVGSSLDILSQMKQSLCVLARLDTVTITDTHTKTATQVGTVEQGIELYIDLAGLVDKDKEKERLEKEKQHIEPYITALEQKLANEQFVNNAPPQVVEQEKQKLSQAKETHEKIMAQLASLH